MVTVGGGIRSYTVGGDPVIDGYGPTETCTAGRGQLLLPWPNRLGDGHYGFEGLELQAPLTEPEHHNAIHGLVRWCPWTVSDVSANRVRLDFRLHPQPGWAWILDVSVTYTLSEQGLEVHTAAQNLPGGAGPCPFGAGWHPYLAAFGGVVDDTVLTVPAGTAYVADERGLPTGTRAVGGSDVDFRSGRRIGPAQLDTAFTDLTRGGDGRAVVRLARGDRVVDLWMDAAYTHVMVFSGDTVPEPHRRRRGLAVEPMTCAPDMLRSGDGRLVLEESGRFEAGWGLQV